MNYDCVRRQCFDEFGTRDDVRRLPYAAEQAFLERKEMRGEPPELRALEPKDAPLVLSVSRHDPRKGVDILNPAQPLALEVTRAMP